MSNKIWFTSDDGYVLWNDGFSLLKTDQKYLEYRRTETSHRVHFEDARHFIQQLSWYFTLFSCNIEYVSLSEKYINGSLEVLQNSFFLQESFSIVCGIPNDPNGKRELERLCLEAAEDGISIIAVDKKMNKVAGVAFNKFHVNDGNPSFYEKFAKTCKSSSSRDLIQFMNDADSRVNLFEFGETNCLFEVMFLAVHSKYQRKKIGSKLVQISVQVAEQLSQGINIKHSLYGAVPLTSKPGMVTALFTSNNSQRIGKILNFKIAAEISYKDMKRNDKTFYELLGGKQEKSLVVYKVL